MTYQNFEPLDKLALLLLCDAFGLTDLPHDLNPDTIFIVSSGYQPCDDSHFHAGIRIQVSNPDITQELQHPRLFDTEDDALLYADGWAKAFISVLEALGITNRSIEISQN